MGFVAHQFGYFCFNRLGPASATLFVWMLEVGHEGGGDRSVGLDKDGIDVQVMDGLGVGQVGDDGVGFGQGFPLGGRLFPPLKNTQK